MLLHNAFMVPFLFKMSMSKTDSLQGFTELTGATQLSKVTFKYCRIYFYRVLICSNKHDVSGWI